MSLSGKIIDLKDGLDQTPLHIEEGESFEIVGNFVDGSGDAITLSNLSTLVLTIYTEEDAGITTRNAQDIKNANDGTVSAGGALSFKAQVADTATVSTDLGVGDFESHIFRFKWTWVDAELTTQTGITEARVLIRKLATPS